MSVLGTVIVGIVILIGVIGAVVQVWPSAPVVGGAILVWSWMTGTRAAWIVFAIAAAVLGGTSLTGGVGTIPGTLIGALIIGVLNNGMNMLSIHYFIQLVVKGVVILVAVWLDVRAKQRKD